MNKILLCILIGLSSVLGFGQSNSSGSKISAQTKQIVSELIEGGGVESSSVGYGNKKPKQWENFERFRNNASVNELVELTNHYNGVVRCYSFWALKKHKDMDLFPLLKEHVNDTLTVWTFFGCSLLEEKVRDFIFKFAEPKQMRELDSLSVRQSVLNKKNTRIDAMKPEAGKYFEIRKHVLKEKEGEALVLLSRYKKRRDIRLIKNFHVSASNEAVFTYRAIRNFPHEEFFSLLKTELYAAFDNTYYSTPLMELYEAIAGFKNAKAVELLDVPFDKIEAEELRRHHVYYIGYALMNNRDAMYDDLLWKIWEEGYTTTPDIYPYLSSLNPDRARKLEERDEIAPPW